MALFLSGCVANDGLPASVEKEMEQYLDMDVVIPEIDGLSIVFAEVTFPPIINNQPVGNGYQANIAYATEKGNLIKLSEDQKKRIEQMGERKYLYGPYEGQQPIRLEIWNMNNHIHDAKTNSKIKTQ